MSTELAQRQKFQNLHKGTSKHNVDRTHLSLQVFIKLYSVAIIETVSQYKVLIQYSVFGRDTGEGKKCPKHLQTKKLNKSVERFSCLIFLFYRVSLDGLVGGSKTLFYSLTSDFAEHYQRDKGKVICFRAPVGW